MSRNQLSDMLNEKSNSQHSQLVETLRRACKKIAPVWPLESFVAVNPYLGLADHKFDQAAHLLAKLGGVQMTLPVSFYLDALKEGKIRKEDIEAVLCKKGSPETLSTEDFIKKLRNQENTNTIHPEVNTVADVASKVMGKDWNRFFIDRISVWAASYFDQGQAFWSTTNQETNIFAAWKEDASIDCTPKVMGLSRFNKVVKSFPNQPLEAAYLAFKKLGIPESGLDIYLHRLLLRVGGWSAFAARIDWDNELYGGKDGALIELLCILLCWEVCLLESLNQPQVKAAWREASQTLKEVASSNRLNHLLATKLILQEAFDLTAQRLLIEKFANQTQVTIDEPHPPAVQAIFCIDVRSEVFRRNLELLAPDISTIGFAGFFAFPIKYIPIGHENGNAQCPVLLPTGPVILEEMPEKLLQHHATQSRKLKHHVDRAWKSFKLGAISCFSFVGPVGLSYLPKLFTDSFGLTRPVPHPDREGIKSDLYAKRNVSLETAKYGNETVGIPLSERIQMAKTALQAMSLTEGFARIVMIVGHGSTTVNNPHATGLDCGACGGHTGEANARVAAAVLNDKAVREGLKEEHIIIPESTIFIACQHDTTIDEITLFNEKQIPDSHQQDMSKLRQQLSEAGHASRNERALRLQIGSKNNVDSLIKARSKDWAQVRPEWGLAGCSAFVVAPRSRTQKLNLEGRSFLHSYDWKKDQTFGVLELIMTAPMVVTSWINLQYYASTVDNEHFGSGNKTLHNVTGGIGVLEGNVGDLRTGLPWQSVHDGEQFQHEPLKLNVIIEAPLEAMNTVLDKHESVRQLCDNGWIHLLAMNDQGYISHRYIGDLKWETIRVKL